MCESKNSSLALWVESFTLSAILLKGIQIQVHEIDYMIGDKLNV